MAWYMNEERELLRATFREFAQTRVREHVHKMEENEENAAPLIKEMGEAGFLGLCIEEEYGGAGVDFINWGLLMEELGRESLTVSLLTMLTGYFSRIFIDPNGGTEEQRQKYVPSAVTGESIFALASCEPSGAVYVEGYETKAVRDGDDWIINGNKVFITEADVADYFLVLAKTKDEINWLTSEGVDLFVVPASAEGVSTGHIENKIGWKGSRTGNVYFKDVRVSESDRLLTGLLSMGDTTKYCGAYAAMALGACESVFEKTVAYMKQREQYGVSIWDAHESARSDAAKLYAKISNFRNSVYGHLMNLNNGEHSAPESISLKVETPKFVQEVVGECMTLMGGTGVVYETGIERFYRDGKVIDAGCGSTKSLLTQMAMYV